MSGSSCPWSSFLSLPSGAGCAGEASTYAGQPAGCRRAEAGLALTVHTTPAAYPSAERWRAAQWGTYVVFVLIGGLIALAWRPREHTLVLQHMLVTAAAGAVLAALLSPALLPIVLAPALIVVLLPEGEELSLALPGVTVFEVCGVPVARSDLPVNRAAR